jgi:hypothetical protein
MLSRLFLILFSIFLQSLQANNCVEHLVESVSHHMSHWGDVPSGFRFGIYQALNKHNISLDDVRGIEHYATKRQGHKPIHEMEVVFANGEKKVIQFDYLYDPPVGMPKLTGSEHLFDLAFVFAKKKNLVPRQVLRALEREVLKAGATVDLISDTDASYFDNLSGSYSLTLKFSDGRENLYISYLEVDGIPY